MPGRSSGTSRAGTIACTSRSERSTIVSSGDFDGDLLAGLHIALRDDPGKRRDDVRIGECVLRELHLRLRRLDVAAGDVIARLGIVEGVLRDEAVVEQPQVHRARLVGERQLGACALERTHPIGKARAQIGRIDPRKALARAHRIALAQRQVGDIAGDLGLDERLPHGLQRSRDRQPVRERQVLHANEIGCHEFQRNGARAIRPARSGIARMPRSAQRDRARERPTRASATSAPAIRFRVGWMDIRSPCASGTGRGPCDRAFGCATHGIRGRCAPRFDASATPLGFGCDARLPGTRRAGRRPRSPRHRDLAPRGMTPTSPRIDTRCAANP